MASQSLPGDPLAQKEFYWRRYCHNMGEKQRQSAVQGMCWVFSVCPQISALPCSSLWPMKLILQTALQKKKGFVFSFSLSLASWFGNRLRSFSMGTASKWQPHPTGYSIYWVPETASSSCPFRSRGNGFWLWLVPEYVNIPY